MSNTPHSRSRSPSHSRALPRSLAHVLLRRLLPRAERRELLHDLGVEYQERVAAHGEPQARRWLWRQAMGSVPALLTWSGWRALGGFEAPANDYGPGGPMLKYLMADLRFAARRLRARPMYSVIAIGTLALGIGGIAAVYGVASPLVLKPLPYANEKSVVEFWFSGSWTEQEFLFLRGRFPGFQQVATYRHRDLTMRNDGSPARLLPGITSSYELFDVLGVRPLLGRGFQPGDDVQGAEPVVVLSHGLWQELGADRRIIGQRITLDGAPRTVVGVMPRGFWFPDPAVRVWTPRALNPQSQNGSYTLIGQVAPTFDAHHMEASVAQLVRILDERFDYPLQWDKIKNAVVTPIRESLLGPMQPAIIATFVAMVLILLIACTNVAALLLGQLEGRATEFAVRSALGANRRRLTQPLVVEAVLLGVVAAIVGAGLAAGGFRVLVSALPLGAWGETAQFDWTLFAVALAVAMLAVLLIVFIPGLSLRRHDARGDLFTALSRARTGGVQGGRLRLEGLLVVAEVALAMLIASGAALLVRSVSRLYDINPGIATEGVGVLDVVAGGDLSPAQRQASLDALVLALGQMPGVESAAASLKVPLRGNGNSFDITIEGRDSRERTTTYFRVSTADYLRTMRMHLVRGRWFDVSDHPDSAEVAVVINEALARRYFPGEDPIGRRVGGGFDTPQRIIGVVANVAEGDLTGEVTPARYYLASQVPWFGSNATLLFRASRAGDLPALLERARREIGATAPGFAVQEVTTMQHVLDQAVGPARQIMSLLTLLSSLALVLGGVGIYGVISHFATRRRRDWAIKVALGLSGPRVIAQVVRQGLMLVGAGIVFGAAGTLSLTRFLNSFLYGVTGLDVAAFAGASVAVLLTGALAAFVPAWRAGRVDPSLVLREQ